MARRSAMNSAFKVAGIFSVVVLIAASPSVAETARPSKDVGPSNVSCDAFGKGTTQWSLCVGLAKAGMPDTELFYAGYWLAKSGQYKEALGYLNLAQKKDERVLTYMGFATRKLGDVDAALPLYVKALEINPNYSVARAYMGEAFLTRGEPDRAKAELREIESRCGATCAEYADLKAHISDYESLHSSKG